MDWGKVEKSENESIIIPSRWLHLYYYEALNILFRFENSLRVFVYTVLKNELKERWQDAALSGGGTIKIETKKRIHQSKDYGYLGYELPSPMLFLNSGELVDIITSETYWKFFAKYFKAYKSNVRTKLQEIGTVRNSLAHFRPIKEDDVQVIKQNTVHVLLGIEKLLSDITNINQFVPTNSKKNWYESIKLLSTKNVVIKLLQSESKDWISVKLSYSMATISSRFARVNYLRSTVTNLRGDEVLNNFDLIKNNCIYLKEGILRSVENDKIKCQKVISIVFSDQVLSSSLDNILKGIKQLVDTIEDETAMVGNDIHARGSIIEAKDVIASYKSLNSHPEKGYWVINTDKLSIDVATVSDVEYWGFMNVSSSDFVCASSQYPWMPTAISEDDIDF